MMIQSHLSRLAGALLLGLAVFGLSHARGSANVDVEERKLEAFVEAAAAVETVIATWQPRIVRAEAETSELLRDQANLEIRKSIDDVDGISYDEYRELRQAMTMDPAMRKRLDKVIQRLQP